MLVLVLVLLVSAEWLTAATRLPAESLFSHQAVRKVLRRTMYRPQSAYARSKRYGRALATRRTSKRSNFAGNKRRSREITV